MQWEIALLTWFAALLALIVAATALLISRSSKRSLDAAYASLAKLSGELSQWEKTQRSTASLLGELADVRDAIDKGNALLKRVNSRETMRERRESSTSTAVDGYETKDDLRRRAGIVAGKPAPHT